MADRVSASITIGGALSASLLEEFAQVIDSERVGVDWDGTPFDPGALPEDNALRPMAHEVAWAASRIWKRSASRTACRSPAGPGLSRPMGRGTHRVHRQWRTAMLCCRRG